MSNKVQVNINFATDKEFAKIQGIGPKLGKRIVAHRDQNGPFSKTSELLDIEGIGKTKAQILGESLSWSIPDDKGGKKSNYSEAILGALAIILLGWYFSSYLPTILIQFQTRDFWLILSATAAFLIYLFALFFFLTAIFGSLTTSQRNHIRSFELEIHFLLAAWASLFLNQLLAIGYFLNIGQLDALQSQYYLIRVTNSLFLFLFVAPQIAFLFFPKLLTKSWPFWISEIGLLGGTLMAAIIVLNEDSLPPIQLFLMALLFGIASLAAGLSLFFTRKPSLYSFVYAFEHLTRSGTDISDAWVRWINLRIPDPTSQENLLKALQSRHKPSRTRRLFSMVFISAGGWLIITLIEAVISWFIQHWLGSHIQ